MQDEFDTKAARESFDSPECIHCQTIEDACNCIDLLRAKLAECEGKAAGIILTHECTIANLSQNLANQNRFWHEQCDCREKMFQKVKAKLAKTEAAYQACLTTLAEEGK